MPASVIKAMGFTQDWKLRAKVLQLLDEVIVPKSEFLFERSDRTMFRSCYQGGSSSMLRDGHIITLFCFDVFVGSQWVFGENVVFLSGLLGRAAWG